MLRVIFCGLLLAATTVHHGWAEDGQMDAYAALLAAGRERGDVLLGSLVEMRGIDGEPQPRRWTMSFRDATARGGIRELIVSPKGIIGERTPLRPAAQGATVMEAAGLKLNSTGAFEAANREASRARIGFHSINYRLFNRQGTPVWQLELVEVGGNQVGQIEFSAADGTIVSALRPPQPADAVPPPEVPPVMPDSAAEAVVPPPPADAAPPPQSTGPSAGPDGRSVGERWVEGGGLVGHVERLGGRTWDATSDTASRIGDSIGAFFIGRTPDQTPTPPPPEP